MTAEAACRAMSNNRDAFPTNVPFLSALLTEVVAYHPDNKAAQNTGRFKWMDNERNSTMRVLCFEKTPRQWLTISWKKSAVKYDKMVKGLPFD